MRSHQSRCTHCSSIQYFHPTRTIMLFFTSAHAHPRDQRLQHGPVGLRCPRMSTPLHLNTPWYVEPTNFVPTVSVFTTQVEFMMSKNVREGDVGRHSVLLVLKTGYRQRRSVGLVSRRRKHRQCPRDRG